MTNKIMLANEHSASSLDVKLAAMIADTNSSSPDHNRKLQISTAPTKAKSREPAYLQALVKNKIDRQRVRFRESGRRIVGRLWWVVFRVETGVGRRG